MTIFWVLSFAAVAVVVVYVMDPFRWFGGSGQRRANTKPAGEPRVLVPRVCENCGHVPGMPTVAELADSDRSDPAPTISAPAPIEQGCRDTPASNADTQPVDVSELRNAIGEGDTAVIPVVAIPPAMPLDPVPPVALTDEQKAELTKWATTTGPGPMHEVPVGFGKKASVAVHTHLDEAS